MRPLALLALLLAGILAGARLTPAAEVGGEVGAARIGAVERGAYVFRAAGCYGCHTDRAEAAQPLAGDRALATPFGTFYSPNITPDRLAGIGGWREEDLRRALKDGRAPDGRNYYPAFPYASYSGMADQDIADLWAYLSAQPPAPGAVRDHDLSFPFYWRPLVTVWRWLFFDPEPFKPDPNRSEAWNRGAYLVRHLGHCGECHSPRGWLGAVDRDRELAGNPQGPDGKKVPDIARALVGDWTADDIAYLLATGLTPQGDVVTGAMGEVVRESTRHLTPEDRAAIVVYLLSLSPGD